MADTKISALTAASAAAGANEFPINEAGTTKKVTGTQIAAMVQGLNKASAANAKDTTDTSHLLTPANMIDVGLPRLLFVLLNADMNSTSDQQFTKVGTFTNFVLLQAKCSYVSGAALTTAAGGIYTAASKGGTAIVANTQTYTQNTAAGTGTNLTLAAAPGSGERSDGALYLSLTTPQGSAGVSNIRVYGYLI